MKKAKPSPEANEGGRITRRALTEKINREIEEYEVLKRRMVVTPGNCDGAIGALSGLLDWMRKMPVRAGKKVGGLGRK